jgi:hypothetical protein
MFRKEIGSNTELDCVAYFVLHTKNDWNGARKEDEIDGLCRMQHAYGMRKISNIFDEKTVWGKNIYGSC